MKKIGLCQIVKNESHVIERCLNSVKRLIDYVLIVDTGSTDNTVDVIRNWLDEHQIAGEVVSEPWQNFAHNRTFALRKLMEKDFIDYALMLDADEILVFDKNFDTCKFKSNLTSDVYSVVTKMGGCTYTRPQITSNKKPFEYRGVVHEYLDMSGCESNDTALGFFNSPIQDSHRNSNGNKFLQDVTLLESALENSQDEPWIKPRYTFYLAQSYRDLGLKEKALENYLKRADMGFWIEEQYVSLYNAGNIMRDLAYPGSEVIQTYMRAIELIPERAEAFYGAVNYCRLHECHQQGYMIGKYGLDLQSKDVDYDINKGLFIQSWIYEYGLLDEFSIVAYWSRNYVDARNACQKLLDENKLPEGYAHRVKNNLMFAFDKLHKTENT
jgi:glycosyltransferase involved in cell wall biosynthesis